jgi:penicillin-binding protein A
MDERRFRTTAGSPLLCRAKDVSKKTSRLRIPRKGRIRVVLVALLLLIGWKVYTGSEPSELGDDGAAGADTSTAGTKRSGRTVKESSSGPTSKQKLSARPRRYDYETVSNLLRRNTARLHFGGDTLQDRGGRIAVHYSVDTMLQRYGRMLMARYHPKYGAIVLLEARSGRVLSLVSYCNDDEPYLGRHLYCRDFFPAASVIKTMVAAAGIEKGHLSPSSKMRHTGRNHTLYKSQLESDLEVYRTVTLASAFARSVNPVFGRIGIYVLGREGLREYADRFGFDQPIPFELPTDEATLAPCDSTFAQAEVASGFNQKTRIPALFGALMAAGVCEQGTIPRPSLVDSMVDARSGRLLYRAGAVPWRKAVEPTTAERVARMMRGVVRYGTARKSFSVVKNTRRFRNLEFGGKTGSVDKDGVGRVDWFEIGRASCRERV